MPIAATKHSINNFKLKVKREEKKCYLPVDVIILVKRGEWVHLQLCDIDFDRIAFFSRQRKGAI